MRPGHFPAEEAVGPQPLQTVTRSQQSSGRAPCHVRDADGEPRRSDHEVEAAGLAGYASGWTPARCSTVYR
ncbi:hypothetical protein PSCLAVI8L_490017 [Pseudoclavibacter sp. 8L]|nr:hypothetical protein PSCLAVI8L_490017 [Pseudoclavibacter sp. 8L]